MPCVIVIFSMCFYPLIYAVWLSFHRLFAFGIPKFIGLRNYAYLSNNPAFWNAFKNGLIWTFSTLALQVLFGIASALVLNEPFKGRSIARGLVLIPYVVPSICAITFFRMSLLNSSWGFFNQVLGIRIAWLGSPDLAMVSLIIVGTWKFYPFVTIAMIARLQTIPPDLYDAAKVDGAGALSRFVHITLPGLADVLAVTVLFRTIFMYTKFDVPWLLTRGGPLSSTETLPVLTYEVSVGMMRRGLGSAIGVTLFVALVIMTVVYLRLYRRRGNGS